MSWYLKQMEEFSPRNKNKYAVCTATLQDVAISNYAI